MLLPNAHIAMSERSAEIKCWAIQLLGLSILVSALFQERLFLGAIGFFANYFAFLETHRWVNPGSEHSLKTLLAGIRRGFSGDFFVNESASNFAKSDTVALLIMILVFLVLLSALIGLIDGRVGAMAAVAWGLFEVFYAARILVTPKMRSI